MLPQMRTIHKFKSMAQQISIENPFPVLRGAFQDKVKTGKQVGSCGWWGDTYYEPIIEYILQREREVK